MCSQLCICDRVGTLDALVQLLDVMCVETLDVLVLLKDVYCVGLSDVVAQLWMRDSVETLDALVLLLDLMCVETLDALVLLLDLMRSLIQISLFRLLALCMFRWLASLLRQPPHIIFQFLAAHSLHPATLIVPILSRCVL